MRRGEHVRHGGRSYGIEWTGEDRDWQAVTGSLETGEQAIRLG